MPGLTVLALADERWQKFVADHPLATPFHSPAWAQLVADAYRFPAFAAGIADERGELRSGLPVVAVRHLLGHARWVALPFTDYCPPLVASGPDERVLAEALLAAARRQGATGVELRAPLSGAAALGGPAKRHVLELDPDPSVVAARFHPSQVRRNVRRAEREGLTVRRGVEPDDLLSVFYDLHLRTRRRQGVPIQPRRFFRLIWERLISRGLGWVDVVEASGRPVAAAVFLVGYGRIVYKYGASDERAWSLRPNHLLFSNAIRAACVDGYATFDFGRTDANHESLAAFKRSWGAREEPLVYSGLNLATRGDAGHGTAGRLLGQIIRHAPEFVCRATGELLYRYVA